MRKFHGFGNRLCNGMRIAISFLRAAAIGSEPVWVEVVRSWITCWAAGQGQMRVKPQAKRIQANIPLLCYAHESERAHGAWQLTMLEEQACTGLTSRWARSAWADTALWT